MHSSSGSRPASSSRGAPFCPIAEVGDIELLMGTGDLLYLDHISMMKAALVIICFGLQPPYIQQKCRRNPENNCVLRATIRDGSLKPDSCALTLFLHSISAFSYSMMFYARKATE